jgi:hypothetical protein
LINDGKGNFRNAIDQWAPGLKNRGMVSSASFADLNRDGRPDLVLAGEWMPITLFFNNGKQLVPALGGGSFQNFSGWWQRLAIADIDGDGDLDLIGGNYGLNSKLQASSAYPLKLFVFDYDDNGRTDQILACPHNNGYYPFLGKDELERQMPGLKKEFLKYSDFADKTVEEIFGSKLDNAKKFNAEEFRSMVFLNDGKGNFSPAVLPREAQVAPLFALAVDDINGDGLKDIICGGNFYGVLPYEGRYDASAGALLLQNKNGQFNSLDYRSSGLLLNGEVRDIKLLRTRSGKTYYLVARNNDRLECWEKVLQK